MMKIAIAIGTVLGLIGTSAFAADFADSERGAAFLLAFKAHKGLSDQLKDYYGSYFRGTTAHVAKLKSGKRLIFLCGEVNPSDGAGAYAGWTAFVVTDTGEYGKVEIGGSTTAEFCGPSATIESAIDIGRADYSYLLVKIMTPENYMILVSKGAIPP